MRRIFGTDGVRGRANAHPMTGEIAFRLGQAAALTFGGNGRRSKFIIGKDTRRSGYIFEYALTAGLCSAGADVHLVGPMPTPAVAHLVRSFAAEAGIVISASHNPAEDNGIKFFDSNGFKLPDETEQRIEALALEEGKISLPEPLGVGKAYRIDDASGRYIEFVKGSAGNVSLKGLKIVLDCANGAAYRVAPLIVSELGAELVVFGNIPDGLNINRECGALCTELVRSAVLGHQAHVGIALDGDADRVILVDEKGSVVGGDEILAICALDMKRAGTLRGDAVVATVMSNMAMEIALKGHGIATVRAPVGDRYVIEQMRQAGCNLGGEQSGHIIFGDLNTTGDGTMAALQVLKIMKETGKSLSLLADVFTPFPQVIENVPVREKRPMEKMQPVKKAVEAAERELLGNGRVLVRYSGTENRCRVMVEGNNMKLIKRLSSGIVSSIKREVGA